MIDKVQRFLKAKHKYDKKPELKDQFELFTKDLNNLLANTKSGISTEIRQSLGTLLVDLIKYANTQNIDLVELFQKDLKFSV
jgi:uncharacterized FlaG/YvyC family protein